MSTNECYCYRGCCTEWEQEILLYMDHELSPDSCERVQRHLDRCESCARFYRIIDREEQLLSGRLRHQVELMTEPNIIADLVMSDIPAFQPITLPQRVLEYTGAAFSYVTDRNRRHYSLAASILVCLMGVLLAMQVGNVTEEQLINIQRSGSYVRVAPKEPIWINLDEGEFFELPDGSIVYATKDTFFSVNSYNKGNDGSIDEERSLHLITGALCIDVHPHPDKIGFSVVCQNAKATVFGTQFFVSTNTGQNKTTVVGVRKGQVMVEKKGKGQLGSTLLSPKEMAVVSSFNGKVYLSRSFLQAELRKFLDCFNEARSDRSARRMLPVLSAVGSESLMIPSDLFMKFTHH